MSERSIRKLLLFVCTIPLLSIATSLSYSVYQDSINRSIIKDDYAAINSIHNGMLSVEVWKESVVDIVAHQIESFELTKNQDSTLQDQLTEMIQNLIDKADQSIQADSKGFKKTMRKWAVNAFVNTEKLKSRAPVYSRQIIDEVMKKKNKKKFKDLAVSKLNEFAEQTYDFKDSSEVIQLYKKYGLSPNDDISSILLVQSEER